MLRSFALLLVMSLLACGGPIGPLSGGRLSGEPGPDQVDDWSVSDAHEAVQLEVRPADPHSVNVWCVGIGEQLYVPTSMILGPTDPAEREWVAAVGADPRVRVRIGDLVYARTAARVDDEEEFERARAALEKKYEIEPADRDPERTIWIFRLDPRAT